MIIIHFQNEVARKEVSNKFKKKFEGTMWRPTVVLHYNFTHHNHSSIEFRIEHDNIKVSQTYVWTPNCETYMFGLAFTDVDTLDEFITKMACNLIERWYEKERKLQESLKRYVDFSKRDVREMVIGGLRNRLRKVGEGLRITSKFDSSRDILTVTLYRLDGYPVTEVRRLQGKLTTDRHIRYDEWLDAIADSMIKDLGDAEAKFELEHTKTLDDSVVKCMNFFLLDMVNQYGGQYSVDHKIDGYYEDGKHRILSVAFLLKDNGTGVFVERTFKGPDIVIEEDNLVDWGKKRFNEMKADLDKKVEKFRKTHIDLSDNVQSTEFYRHIRNQIDFDRVHYTLVYGLNDQFEFKLIDKETGLEVKKIYDRWIPLVSDGSIQNTAAREYKSLSANLRFKVLATKMRDGIKQGISETFNKLHIDEFRSVDKKAEKINDRDTRLAENTTKIIKDFREIVDDEEFYISDYPKFKAALEELETNIHDVVDVVHWCHECYHLYRNPCYPCNRCRERGNGAKSYFIPLETKEGK